MKVPAEISFRDMPQDEQVEKLVRRKAEKLERICDYISSCRVTVEKESRRRQTGDAYHVRIDLTVPPGHELVVSRDPGQREEQHDLNQVVRRAFDAAERQLKELVEKQRGEVKTRPEQQLEGVVVRIFKDKGFGFLRDQSGRQVYFHRNSVLENGFDRMVVGVGVNFFEHEQEGEYGPQASTVRIVDKPGVRAPKEGEAAMEPPLGWED